MKLETAKPHYSLTLKFMNLLRLLDEMKDRLMITTMRLSNIVGQPKRYTNFIKKRTDLLEITALYK